MFRSGRGGPGSLPTKAAGPQDGWYQWQICLGFPIWDLRQSPFPRLAGHLPKKGLV